MGGIVGNFRTFGRGEGPMFFVVGTLFDPAAEDFDLRGGERFRVIGGGHPLVVVCGGDAEDQLAGDRIFSGVGSHVEPQFGFAFRGVKPVALEAVAGEDRADVAVEIDGVGARAGECDRCDEEELAEGPHGWSVSDCLGK